MGNGTVGTPGGTAGPAVGDSIHYVNAAGRSFNATVKRIKSSPTVVDLTYVPTQGTTDEAQDVPKGAPGSTGHVWY